MMITKDAAAYLKISLYYLRNLRQGLHNHEGPKFTMKRYRNSLAAYYEIADLDAWKAQHKFRRKK